MGDDEIVEVGRRPNRRRPDIPLYGRTAVGGPAQVPDLVHVTAAGSAREIIGSKAIEPRYCSVFRKDLVYFFVGNAAYRLRNGEEKSEQISRFPVALVFDHKRLGIPHHAYPLDTGALMSGIFGEHPDPHVFLEDYELEPTIESVAAHIEWAFGGNKEYLGSQTLQGLKESLPYFDEIARSFLSIAHLASNEKNRPDARAASVEIAYSTRVELRGAIKFAVFPKQYLEHGPLESPLAKRLEELGCEISMYDWQPNRTPDYFASEVLERVQAFELSLVESGS